MYQQCGYLFKQKSPEKILPSLIHVLREELHLMHTPLLLGTQVP